MSAMAWAREMASYNRWQNETLYSHCAALGDDARRKHRGMFFACIHNTLDHILMVDARLLEFAVTGTPPAARFEPARVVHDDYEVLTRERRHFDDALPELFEQHDDAWLAAPITFATQRLDRERVMPRQIFLGQMFNHATHHRAQVTSELHKLGIDYGNTDIPFNPHSTF